VPVVQKALDEVRSNETCPSRDENSHPRLP
jgi:hypothetical protein